VKKLLISHCLSAPGVCYRRPFLLRPLSSQFYRSGHALWMTSIDEMDEFFYFEDATNPAVVIHGVDGVVPAPHPTLSGYDIDLILNQAAGDNGSLASFQQSGSEIAPNFVGYRLGHFSDIHMGVDNVNEHNHWSSSAEQSSRPCVNCRRNKLDCVRVPAGDLLGQLKCTSCTLLSRKCSLSSDASDDYSEFSAYFRPSAVDNADSLGEGSSSYDKEGYAMETSITAQNKRQEPAYRAKNECNKNYGQPGIRFSRETVRLLRNWLSIHHLHPYPTEDEKEDLQQKTGLTKIQITNWLANARRRGQVRAPRARSPHTLNQSQSITVPKQPKTALANMAPMERWEKLPPEHEPASVVDIAKAAKTSPVVSSNEASPYSYPRSNDGSVRSIARASSTGSRNTSKSSHASLRSGLSHHSRASFGQRGRRRRRPAGKAGTNLATIVPRQYQCTFCIETFKTKHDWQRHEKSLHLSLERWICAPNINKLIDTAHSCAFCGIHDPDATHYETHNYTVCRERSLDERTFYRKDHLRQHLRLVHECQFLPSTMESWKVAAPEVRSRCGFCGHIMETWAARVDHLAEHYKAGKSMAHWKGSWSFEPDVQKLVENGMPPCESNQSCGSASSHS
jgi:Homeobox KN domain